MAPKIQFTDIYNRITVKHRQGALYSAKLAANAPGKYPMRIQLGDGENDYLDTNPIGGLDIVIECPIHYGLEEVEGDYTCVCIEGWQPLNLTDDGLLVTRCELCAPGYFKDTKGNVACSPSQAGFSQPRVGSTNQTACNPGNFSVGEAIAECEMCPVGQYQDESQATECKDCPVGMFQDQMGQDQCELCAAGTFNNLPGQEKCTPCPLYTNSTLGAIECTFCTDNRQRLPGVAAETYTCERCPNRAECPYEGTDGLEGITLDLIDVNRAYWRLDNLSRDVQACAAYGDTTPCTGGQLGGVDGSGYCEPGYVGPLCSVCDAGFWNETRYFEERYAECKRCPSASYFSALYISLICIPLVLFIVLRHVHNTGSPRKLAQFLVQSMMYWKSLSLEARCKQLIGFAQVITAVGSTYSVPTPPIYEVFLQAIEWVYLDVFGDLFIATECLGGYRNLVLIVALFPFGIFILGALFRTAVLLMKALRAHKRPDKVSDEGRKSITELRTWRGLFRQGLLQTLPLALILIFLFCPSISAVVFDAFHCESFSTNTDAGEERYFLYNYRDIECYSSDQSYYANLNLALVFILLWPVGSLIFWAVLLRRARHALTEHKPTSFSRALSFMYRDYRSDLYYWEWLELFRKLFLTSFVLLIPESAAFIRLVVAVLFSLFFILAQIVMRPHRHTATGAISLACQVVILVTYLGATYMKLFDEFSLLYDEPSAIQAILTFSSVDQIAIMCLGVIALLVVLLAGLAWREIRADSLLRVICLKRDHTVPTLSLGKGLKFHIFLSHTWATGQDQVAVMKRSLQRLLPGSAIFLDVDDLEDISALELYVAQSQLIMMFLSRGYFASRNCLREIRASLAQRKPFLLVHETDPNKGGLTLAEACLECPAEARETIFSLPNGMPRPVIDWHRIYDFQMCSLKMIAVGVIQYVPQYAKRSLRADKVAGALSAPAERPGDVANQVVDASENIQSAEELAVYMPGEVTLEHLSFKVPVRIYASPNNPGAFETASELSEVFGEDQLAVEPLMDDTIDDILSKHAAESRNSGKQNARQSFALRSKSRAARAKSGDRLDFLILYLNQKTFLGPEGEAFAEEVRQLCSLIPIVMLHENDPARDGCEFSNFFQTTPADLIDDGLYNTLALAMYIGEHRRVSLKLAAMAFGAKKQGRNFFSYLPRTLPTSIQKGTTADSSVTQKHTAEEGDAEPEATATQADQPTRASWLKRIALGMSKPKAADETKDTSIPSTSPEMSASIPSIAREAEI